MIHSDTGDGVITLTLNRPERHNALVPELLDALLDALVGAQQAAPKALILSANGTSFSTGGDVHELYRRDAAYANGLVMRLNRVIMELLSFPATVFCAAHGWITGGSLGLLLAADRVVARDDLRIAPYYSVVGFSPDGGWTALLPDRIGAHKTLLWITENTTIDARQAAHLGLVDEVVSESPASAAREAAVSLPDAREGVIAHARRLIRNSSTIAARLDAEREAFVEQIQTTAAREGMQRFLAREK